MAKLIAIDLGTTLIKCTLYDEDGSLLAAESLPCRTTYGGGGVVEQDAELWYTGVCGALRRLAPRAADGPVGIGIASQGISVVPVDAALRPLSGAISWLDARAGEEAADMADMQPPAAWFHQTGKFLSPLYTLPRILWLRKRRPDIFEAARWFLLPLDFINGRMTGAAVTDHTMAAGTMCYDVARGDWSDKILSLTGLTRARLAEIRVAGAPVGRLNDETCRRTGLPAGTPVFNGGQDQKVAAYAAGLRGDRATLSLGTAGAMEILVRDATRQSLLPFFPDLFADRTLVEGCINTTGAAIQWMKDTLFGDMDFAEMNRLAQASPPGANGVRCYPHLAKPGTPHRDLDIPGALQGVSLRAGRGDLIRSLYEGLACEIRYNLEFAARAGSALQSLSVFGGASRSEAFCQIIADVTALPLSVAENGELGSVGAAKLAAAGMGLDAEAFARRAAGAVRQYRPDPASVARYESLYQSYIQFYQTKRGV